MRSCLGQQRLSQTIRTHHFSEPGLYAATQLTNVSRKTNLSTREELTHVRKRESLRGREKERVCACVCVCMCMHV